MFKNVRAMAAMFAGFILSALAIMRADGQEFISPNLDRLRLQEIHLLRPLNEIRFDHHLAARQGQIVPQQVTLQPTTLSRPPSGAKSVQWVASNLHYNQPYFEEVLLERYGLSHGPIAQPAVSAAHFFTTAAFLPVLRHSYHRCEIYDHRGFEYLSISN